MKKQVHMRLRFFVIAIVIGGLTLGWSSKRLPPFEPVHQIAIQNALSNKLSVDLITILQNQQKVVDTHQQPIQSFEHSMTGIANANEEADADAQRRIYVTNSETYIHTNLANAIEAWKSHSTNEAFEHLGNAIHALEDATSPAHQPFQIWRYNESFSELISHMFKEYSYPENANDTNQVRERTELEGSVQYAYDIFMEPTNMPVRFFNPTNYLLELPAAYLLRK